MQRPMPMTREFIIMIMLEHHKMDGIGNIHVDAEWAPDWEAVRLTIKATGHKFVWWPVAPELAAKANEASLRCLAAMPLPHQIMRAS